MIDFLLKKCSCVTPSSAFLAPLVDAVVITVQVCPHVAVSPFQNRPTVQQVHHDIPSMMFQAKQREDLEQVILWQGLQRNSHRKPSYEFTLHACVVGARLWCDWHLLPLLSGWFPDVSGESNYIDSWNLDLDEVMLDQTLLPCPGVFSKAFQTIE